MVVRAIGMVIGALASALGIAERVLTMHAVRKNDFLPFLCKGNIPPEIGTFGDFFGVQVLDLSRNELTGTPSLFP